MQGLSGRADAASYVRISENPIQANFSELREGEVPRIPLPRTPVNKDIRKPGVTAGFLIVVRLVS